jgi:iron complex transport system substrate-binding protein
METHPLGRAEWLKFTALFFNKEALAEKAFDEIAQEYERLSQLGHHVLVRPTVLTGTSWRGTWFLPGGKSFMAQFLRDAGAEYLWEKDQTTGAIPMDFESVLAQAQHADFWVNADTWHSVSDVLATDARYGMFKALQTRQVFNREGRVNSQGGNDYFETGVMYPQKVLADLIKIFHPELVPEHNLIWYRQLAPARE